jgi:hypothetical protein
MQKPWIEYAPIFWTASTESHDYGVPVWGHVDELPKVAHSHMASLALFR